MVLGGGGFSRAGTLLFFRNIRTYKKKGYFFRMKHCAMWSVRLARMKKWNWRGRFQIFIHNVDNIMSLKLFLNKLTTYRVSSPTMRICVITSINCNRFHSKQAWVLGEIIGSLWECRQTQTWPPMSLPLERSERGLREGGAERLQFTRIQPIIKAFYDRMNSLSSLKS